ncbi:MAG: NifB/NifX family molybdenum-iron cluster-binding protein [Deltaproteobacteria bacterium]|nr:NifB/NifX family molybdenum-iron cluster-binding protein [Deltaproteobacteria bacterium]MBW1718679.1 NifB/NifX family molybdenum-iron cluster-binding protein [Deltaproteobacteria bacterium]MBW1931662.1 NifB/NifX family molybdenum-iron cluster-binding protein [Deltaproteobacteria bacterium]MBW1937771.1 NifB/NifX family molybdenum-iron cluster-binding protein [Deltaproteobacteria bacterium]MBW1964164.1 NifB/NifX family molybdenum-iron cluster-binding protein [Deltaproteobacteria bacterium]
MKIRSTPTIIVSLFIFFGLAISASADSMKIAVATTCPEKDAAISQQAGRTPFFLFFDDKGNFLETVENPSMDQSRNAGPNAALFLADKGVTLVIAGDFGSKMREALEEHHIQYVKKTGAAYNAVQTIIQNR